MKKKVFFILTILLVLSLFFVNAADENVYANASTCLKSKIDSKGCDSISTEEKIFSLLSIGECKTELQEDTRNGECWPRSDCSVKTTAQAILALKTSGTNTDEAEEWLIEQKTDFSGIDWFLQVESSIPTTCTISYSDSEYSFSINEDKTLSSSAGKCLSVYDDYWFKISPSCYDEEFEISCENSFLTSLLYKKIYSPTFYVSGKTNSASGSASTTETVSSSCFKEDGTCNYEGTLWAAFVLKALNYEINSYLPYLISGLDENPRYLPESFLYSLTGEYKNELLLKQSEEWWLESGDKFYDTAVALLPFRGSEFAEKTSTKEWLAEVQDDDGCWQGNLRNTAFLIYSIWSESKNLSETIEEISDEKDCENSGYYCLSRSVCSSVGGNVLSNYTGCYGTICCDKPLELESCSTLDGELCSSDEECVDGSVVDSSDSNSEKFCCVGGTCEQVTQTSECSMYGGYCKNSCGSSEELSPYSCDSGVCCIPKKSNNLLLIILLSILIILVALGIIFRKKLKDFILKIKTKLFKNSKKKKPVPSKFPQTPSSKVYPGAIQRRIIPPQQPPRTQPVRKPTQNQSEFDDILKKLKDIGK